MGRRENRMREYRKRDGRREKREKDKKKEEGGWSTSITSSGP